MLFYVTLACAPHLVQGASYHAHMCAKNTRCRARRLSCFPSFLIEMTGPHVKCVMMQKFMYSSVAMRVSSSYCCRLASTCRARTIMLCIQDALLLVGCRVSAMSFLGRPHITPLSDTLMCAMLPDDEHRRKLLNFFCALRIGVKALVEW